MAVTGRMRTPILLLLVILFCTGLVGAHGGIPDDHNMSSGQTTDPALGVTYSDPLLWFTIIFNVVTYGALIYAILLYRRDKESDENR